MEVDKKEREQMKRLEKMIKVLRANGYIVKKPDFSKHPSKDKLMRK